MVRAGGLCALGGWCVLLVLCVCVLCVLLVRCVCVLCALGGCVCWGVVCAGVVCAGGAVCLCVFPPAFPVLLPAALSSRLVVGRLCVPPLASPGPGFSPSGGVVWGSRPWGVVRGPGGWVGPNWLAWIVREGRIPRPCCTVMLFNTWKSRVAHAVNVHCPIHTSGLLPGGCLRRGGLGGGRPLWPSRAPLGPGRHPPEIINVVNVLNVCKGWGRHPVIVVT